MKSISKRFETLKDSFQKETSLTNHLKRIYHSKFELLLLEIEENEEKFQKNKEKSRNFEEEEEQIKREINELILILKLNYLTIKSSIFTFFFDFLRLFIVILILFTSGMIISLPMLLLRVTDHFLYHLNLYQPYKVISVATKQFLGIMILFSSGIVIKSEGLEEFSISSKRNLICFTHGSTIDAFVLGSTLPIPSAVLAKKELFLLPYFGWLLQAYGSVPIDRKNRNSAVISLEIATEIADCVTIAPEGTRSTTGLLLPFKKGPFHLWESLNGPIVPLVIIGAFELLPPGIHYFYLTKF